MGTLLKILSDRGFWTSFTTLATWILTRATHMNQADSTTLMGLIAGMCMSLDAVIAANDKKPPPSP